MKLIQLLLIFLLINNSIFSQIPPLKTYTGKYDNGIATYTYYEDSNYERIYEGNFLFKKDPTNFHFQQVEIKGNFSNNLKDGLWEYKGLDKDKANNSITNQLTIIGKYNKGKKDGKWQAKKTFKINNKQFYEELISEFKNDTLIGVFSYKNTLNKSTINGRFDNYGNYDGEWNITQFIKENQYEDIKKFSKGVLIFRLIRNTSTGMVFKKQDYTELIPYVVFQDDSIPQSLSIDLGYKNTFKQIQIAGIETEVEQNKVLSPLDYAVINYWRNDYFASPFNLEKLFFEIKFKNTDAPQIGGFYYGICDGGLQRFCDKTISNDMFDLLMKDIKEKSVINK